MRELLSLISTYSFEVKDALLYGVDEAILLFNIKFWVLTNKSNNVNFFDGRTWTYNSANAYTEIFPFWDRKKICRLLLNLEQKGAIVSGNYNKSEYDRTKWYALTQEPTDWTNLSNGLSKNVQPIPDINTYIRKEINKEKIEGKKSKDFIPPTPEEVKKYIEEKGYNIDPNYFYEYYSSNSWKDNKNKPVKNWKLKALMWSKNNPKVSQQVEEVKTEPVTFGENYRVVTREEQEEYIRKLKEWRLSGGRIEKPRIGF